MSHREDEDRTPGVASGNLKGGKPQEISAASLVWEEHTKDGVILEVLKLDPPDRCEYQLTKDGHGQPTELHEKVYW